MMKFLCRVIVCCLLVSRELSAFVISEREEQLAKTEAISLDGEALIRVVPQGGDGFSWPYVYTIPAGLDRSRPVTIVMLPPNTGRPYDRYVTTEDLVLRSFISDTRWYAKLAKRVVFVTPIVPRPHSIADFYTHALSRKVLFEGAGEYERLDLQVLAMAGDLRAILQAEGLAVSPRFGLIGFSAAGQFANRMGVLHPDSVMFVVAGGLCGLPVLPAQLLGDHALSYPVGASDILQLPGISTNLENIYRAPQFFMIGAEDRNDALRYRDSFSTEQESIVREHFPGGPFERWREVEKCFAGKWGTAEFHRYDRVGHSYDQRMVGEACEFVLRILDQQSSLPFMPASVAEPDKR